MSDLYELNGRVSDTEFEALKQRYRIENSKYSPKMISHVGTGAGLFSELGAMLERTPLSKMY